MQPILVICAASAVATVLFLSKRFIQLPNGIRNASIHTAEIGHSLSWPTDRLREFRSTLEAEENLLRRCVLERIDSGMRILLENVGKVKGVINLAQEDRSEGMAWTQLTKPQTQELLNDSQFDVEKKQPVNQRTRQSSKKEEEDQQENQQENQQKEQQVNELTERKGETTKPYREAGTQLQGSQVAENQGNNNDEDRRLDASKQPKRTNQTSSPKAPSDKMVHLIDAAGKEHHFPFHRVRTWQVRA